MHHVITAYTKITIIWTYRQNRYNQNKKSRKIYKNSCEIILQNKNKSSLPIIQFSQNRNPVHLRWKFLNVQQQEISQINFQNKRFQNKIKIRETQISNLSSGARDWAPRRPRARCARTFRIKRTFALPLIFVAVKERVGCGSR